MGPFSPGATVIPAEKSVKPALRRGYLVAYSTNVRAQLGEIAANGAAMTEF